MRKPKYKPTKEQAQEPSREFREGFELSGLDAERENDMNLEDVLRGLLTGLPKGFLLTPQLLEFMDKLVGAFQTGSMSQEDQQKMVSDLAAHLSRLGHHQPQADAQAQPLNA